MQRWLAPAILVVIALAATACADQFDPTPTPTALPDLLANGVAATFNTPSGQFTLFTVEQPAIDKLFALQAGEISGVFPTGVLAPGDGAGDHNAPWSWHMHRQTIDFVEQDSVVCNGTLQQVEDNVTHWLQNIRRFCPWEAELVSVTDYR